MPKLRETKPAAACRLRAHHHVKRLELEAPNKDAAGVHESQRPVQNEEHGGRSEGTLSTMKVVWVSRMLIGAL